MPTEYRNIRLPRARQQVDENALLSVCFSRHEYRIDRLTGRRHCLDGRLSRPNERCQRRCAGLGRIERLEGRLHLRRHPDLILNSRRGLGGEEHDSKRLLGLAVFIALLDREVAAKTLTLDVLHVLEKNVRADSRHLVEHVNLSTDLTGLANLITEVLGNREFVRHTLSLGR